MNQLRAPPIDDWSGQGLWPWSDEEFSDEESMKLAKGMERYWEVISCMFVIETLELDDKEWNAEQKKSSVSDVNWNTIVEDENRNVRVEGNWRTMRHLEIGYVNIHGKSKYLIDIPQDVWMVRRHHNLLGP